jgi:hypothetical protein
MDPTDFESMLMKMITNASPKELFGEDDAPNCIHDSTFEMHDLEDDPEQLT